MALGLELRRRPVASEVKALAEQTARATGRDSNRLKLEVGKFLNSVRAA